MFFHDPVFKAEKIMLLGQDFREKGAFEYHGVGLRYYFRGIKVMSSVSSYVFPLQNQVYQILMEL